MAPSTEPGAMLARLGLGALLFAGEELSRRAAEWRVLETPPSSDRSLRQVLVGLLAVGPGAAARSGRRLGRWSARRVARLRRHLPIAVTTRMQRVADEVRSAVAGLAEEGAREEARSRVTFARTLQSATVGFLDQLGDATSLRNLVLEQSSSVQEEMVDRLRARLADADTRIERWLHPHREPMDGDS